jgi:hypothetical protein
MAGRSSFSAIPAVPTTKATSWYTGDWSPNGRRLVLGYPSQIVFARAGGTSFMTMPADGTHPRQIRLPSGKAIDYVLNPAWQPLPR